MTADEGAIAVEVDARDVMTSFHLTVKVRGRRRALWRLKIAASLVALAGRVLGGETYLEALFAD